jgi:cell division protein FtsW
MKKITFQLFFVALLLSLIGTIFIYSTTAFSSLEQLGDSFYYVKKQFLWILIGLMCQVVCMKLDVKWYHKNVKYIMAFNFFLLLLVLVPFFSMEIGGARRWLRFFGFSVQPSEFCKLATILCVAKLLALKEENPDLFPKMYIVLFGIVICVFGLIMAERDLGTTVILVSVIILMLYVAGMQLRYLFVMIFLLSPLFYLAIAKHAFRMKRILVYLDPWEDPQNAGYQIIQSMVAIGSGGVTGKGFGQSVQKYYYLPEAHTDFIFSIYAEETGLIGSVLLILLFGFLVVTAMRIAMYSRDLFSHLLASGLSFLFGLQVFVNIGVVTAILPTKGTTLPFISFGGTSLVVHMMAIGILISLEKYNRKDQNKGLVS